MSEDYDIVEHVKWAAKGWRRDDALKSRDPETEAAFCDKIASEIELLRAQVRDAVDGAQPLWSGEVAADKAEILRLRGEVSGWQEIAADRQAAHAALVNEAYRLQGEVERLTALASREGWQDIESAPKDGTPILLAGGADDMLKYTGTSYAALLTAPCRAAWAGDSWLIALAEAGYVGTCREEPTHWMPLPAPPALSSAPKPEGNT